MDLSPFGTIDDYYCDEREEHANPRQQCDAMLSHGWSHVRHDDKYVILCSIQFHRQISHASQSLVTPHHRQALSIPSYRVAAKPYQSQRMLSQPWSTQIRVAKWRVPYPDQRA